jgi:hypothetical protein
MLPLDYVLAVAALTGPAGCGEGESLREHLCLARPIRTLALTWEILDPRETRSVLTRPEDLEGDLPMLRRRYLDLADAPPVIDSMRFPDRACAAELLAFNRAYHAHMLRCHDADVQKGSDVQDALTETDMLYHVWDLVRDARSELYYVSVRRQALAALREALGPACYASGVLPPHVPVWRFPRCD